MATTNTFFAQQTGEIGGYNETMAAAAFESQALFLLRCQYASLVIETFLAGVLVMQLWTYFQYQKMDKIWTKAIVAWSAAWTMVITVYYWVYLSYLFVDNFGLWLPWLEVRWLALMPLFDVLAVIPVQGFFAYRAYLLMNRNKILIGILGLMLLVAAGGGVGVTIVFGGQETLFGATASGPTLISDSLLVSPQLSLMISAWTAVTTGADVIIAGCILAGLIRSKTGWAHTDKLVSKLVRMTFEAQLPPTFLALAYCIEWSQTPSSLLGAVFQCLQSLAYTIGLLFTLNSRIAFTTVDNDNRSQQTPQVFGMSNMNNTRRPTDGIHVDVQTYVHRIYETLHPDFKAYGSVVDWQSKRQAVTATSTLESEYVATACLRRLMQDLGFELPTNSRINCDNQGALALATNPGAHHRTKHIDIRIHMIRDYVEAGLIRLTYVRSKSNIADILTKALEPVLHVANVRGLRIRAEYVAGDGASGRGRSVLRSAREGRSMGVRGMPWK
ncbi:hypothetical protein I350_06395 [Cryptococcus amylolentus CBS 6273]|uniref:DUF6534 domain-containing protein n=1 Tax=Cryptococcus amylolentus CBS 6273 TaxID=1296118 RepID=A0A1E3JL33_9TREE|nr:hypothetical protein I350_06395 [Cryptococcus amylolentus CBS 6273]